MTTFLGCTPFEVLECLLESRHTSCFCFGKCCFCVLLFRVTAGGANISIRSLVDIPGIGATGSSPHEAIWPTPGNRRLGWAINATPYRRGPTSKRSLLLASRHSHVAGRRIDKVREG
jgi:hypothetical protein